MSYTCRHVSTPPRLVAEWSDPTWSSAEVLSINQFHPQSSDHRPITSARMLHAAGQLFVQFHVQDRYVRCVNNRFQDRVSKDSCVECFLSPRADAGYFNFEMNCGGTLLLYYIEDATRTDSALFRKYTVLSEEDAKDVRIVSSLGGRIEPEIKEPLAWTLAMSAPLAFFERFVGNLGELAGQAWAGNFFKCGDETSHPHWASWSDIGQRLRFHQPERFGEIRFERSNRPL
jgi:hypothetical protein